MPRGKTRGVPFSYRSRGRRKHETVIFRDKTIADSMHSAEVSCAAFIRFQLLPQPHDVRIDGARVGIEIIAPNRIKDHVARDNPAGMPQKVRKQVVLQARQLDLHALLGDDAPRQVNFDVSKRAVLGALACPSE